jgi:hypothetical protein
MTKNNNLIHFLNSLAERAKLRPAKDKYNIVKGHRNTVRNLSATQVQELEADGWAVTPVSEPVMSDTYEQVRNSGLTSSWQQYSAKPHMGHVRDALDRGVSMRTPTKVGQSKHYRLWMRDAAFKKAVKSDK